MTDIQAIFTTAINLIGSDKVVELLQTLGYTNMTADADLCIEVLEKEGSAFSIPFGNMLKKAVKKPKAKKFLKEAVKLNRASGQTTGTATDDEKAETALQYLNTIGGILGKGVDNIDDIINATNGSNVKLAEAQYLEAKRKQEEAEQKTTLYWILGGVAVLLVVVVFVIALTKRQ